MSNFKYFSLTPVVAFEELDAHQDQVDQELIRVVPQVISHVPAKLRCKKRISFSGIFIEISIMFNKGLTPLKI